MALELYPTPSWPRPEFSIPFSLEHKKFPHDSEMAVQPLSWNGDKISMPPGEILSFWACDYTNLYLSVEVPGQVDTSRNMAWRYGDGLVLTTSHMAGGKPLQSYTSLGFSGTSKKPQIVVVGRGGTWFPRLDCSNIKYRLHQGSTSRFNITVPWSVLEPIRPLLYETISLNLSFIRRLPQSQGLYQLVEDENYNAEVTNFRRLLPVAISCKDLGQPLAQSFLTRNCWQGKLPLQVNLGLHNPKTCPAKLIITVKDGNNDLEMHSSSVELASGCHHWTLKWSPQRPLPTGQYTLELRGEGYSKNYKKQHSIYILNPEELTSLRSDLQNLEEDINCLYPGAAQTALAGLEWLEKDLGNCSWEQPDFCLFERARFIRNCLRNGQNPLEDKHGLSRRAFRSKTDGSLKPYSLYFPKGFSAERKWPLLMLLHGRGKDEQGTASNLELHRLADKLGIILHFPSARAATGFSQHDESAILENLVILKKRLPLDWDKLFLAGVSTGGFGTLYTGLRHPDHFTGLAVISGTPCFPLSEKDSLDTFCPADYWKNAKKLALLVVHGAKDCAIPPEQVRATVESLRDRKVQVDYREISSGGHGDFDWHSELAAWLRQLLKN